MTPIDQLMKDIAAALPKVQPSGYGYTIRDVALHYYEDGHWEAMAGGHGAVDLGEWCGDFSAHGESAETTLAACLEKIKNHPKP